MLLSLIVLLILGYQLGLLNCMLATCSLKVWEGRPLCPNQWDDGNIHTVSQSSPFRSSIWKGRLSCNSLLVIPEASITMEDKGTYGSTRGKAGGSASTLLIPTPSVLAK